MKKLPYLFVLLLTLIVYSCASDDNTTTTTDTQDPTAPLNLIISNVSENSLQLSWDASTDNVGIIGYNVYQDEIMVITGNSGTSATISSLLADTTYTFYVTAEDAAGNESNSSNVVTTTTEGTPLSFLLMLSDMGIFQGSFSELIPADGVQLYEINSALFTDYSSKQRLLKLPEGTAMRYNNTNLLPVFPNNTLIAKTFYYNIDDRDPSLGKQIIETRLFLNLAEGWQSTNYIWNAAQTDAVRDDNGGINPISYIDITGTTQNIEYQIPSNADCIQCHNNNDVTFPIGLKLRSMNFIPSYTSQNQLQYFTNNGLLEGVPNPADISVLPNWQDDATWSLSDRARAYIDVNCAHCHSPGGSVPPTFLINFAFETPFDDTGIHVNRGEIEARFASTTPFYRMPLLGRTVVHEDALAMLSEYIDSL